MEYRAHRHAERGRPRARNGGGPAAAAAVEAGEMPAADEAAGEGGHSGGASSVTSRIASGIASFASERDRATGAAGAARTARSADAADAVAGNRGATILNSITVVAYGLPNTVTSGLSVFVGGIAGLASR